MRYLILCLLLLLAMDSATAQDDPGFPGVNREPISFYPEAVVPLLRLGRGIAHDIAWSPDGETLAMASSVGVWLYDPDDLEAEPSLLSKSPPEAVTHVAYSPNGRLMAAGGDTLQLWDTGTNELLRSIDTGGAVVSVAFSPDSAQIVSSNRFGSDRYGVWLWDVATGSEIVQLADRRVVANLTFSPDGALIAGVALADCCFSVVMWDAASGEERFNQGAGVRAAPDRVLFSPDSATLTVIDRTGSLLFLDPHDPYGNSDSIVVGEGEDTSDWYPPGAGYTADGGLLVTMSGLGHMRVWNANSLQLVNEFALDWEASSVAFNPDGSRMAAVNRRGGIAIWDTESRALVGQYDGIASSSHTVDFSPDGRWLASDAGVWDIQTGERLWPFSAHEGLVLDVAFSLDGSLLATGSADQIVGVWSVQDRELLHSLTGHEQPVKRVLFIGQEQLLTASDDSVRMWNAATGESLSVSDDQATEAPMQTLELDSAGISGVRSLAYGNDMIALSDDYANIYLWHTERSDATWQTMTHDTFGRGFNALAFSHEWMASAGNDSAVQLWDWRTGDHLGVITTHNSWIYALAFSPDDYLLASAGCAETLRNPWDGSPYCAGADLRLYSLLDNLQYVVPQGHTGVIRDLDFNADGTLLATASEDGTILLWGVPATH